MYVNQVITFGQIMQKVNERIVISDIDEYEFKTYDEDLVGMIDRLMKKD